MNSNTNLSPGDSVPGTKFWMVSNPNNLFPILATALITVSITLLGYISYRPKIDARAPEFTKDTIPIIGSWSFFVKKMGFWKSCTAHSKTGNFSFWLGKNHIVGVSGEAARKMYLENRNLDLIKGIPLIGHGPDFIDGRSTVIHDIWLGTGSSGRTYAQRRLLDLQRNDELAKRLPNVTKDARTAFEDMPKSGQNFIDPAKACFRIVTTQGARIVASDEISDNPKTLKALLTYVPILQFNNSLHLLAFPWLSYFSPIYWRRRYGRRGLEQIVKPIVARRMADGAPRGNDALQVLIDFGDSEDHISAFMTSMLFIAGANTGVITGSMLNLVAHHPQWQNKIYEEIRAKAACYSQDIVQSRPLVDQLDSLPLEAWEAMSRSIDLIHAETIRMWVAFPMGRYNDTSEPIPIPGSDEVIPPGSFACYNTVDAHYDEKLYPDPMKWDPERWSNDRKEFEQEAYGYMGWGGGRHPCIGMRWAKIQQNIILAYALAMYKWNGCDENGNDTTEFRQPNHALAHLAPKLPSGTHIKFVPRQE